MTPRTTLRTAFAAACAALALTAPSANAIVGGTDAPAGKWPAVAEIGYAGLFGCTGTLIAPTFVLTAGHCDSLTGAAAGTPATWPAPLIDVRLGSNKSGQGQRVAVKRVIAHPSYVLTDGYDVSLLELAAPAPFAPVKVAGAGETSSWAPGTLESIVGWGVTSEGGTAPDTLQEAQVPVVTDAGCAAAYSSFDRTTMLCAGFPEGGVDTCQGDSGGPMFGRTVAGALRVVGATSFGDGCARPGKPGVYARVGDQTLREWLRSKAPAGVA